LHQQCDLIINDLISPLFRKKIDFTTPWIFAYYGLLIPVDDDTANIQAVVKPFQWPVHIFSRTKIVLKK
jgi:ionotropic glutamate receptor